MPYDAFRSVHLFHGIYALYLLVFLNLPSARLAAEMPLPASSMTADDPAAQNAWQLWRENEHSRVRYRPVNDSPLIEISAELKLSSTLSGFLLFLQDYPNIPNWLDNASQARLLAQITPRENIFITYFDGFWPVKAREMLIHSTYWQNPDLSVEIAVNDASHALENNTNAIRIKIHNAHWQLTPLADKQLKIHYRLIASPEGNLPLWLANKLSLRAMWKTLQALHKQLPLSKWQQKSIPGIKEQD
ncbi:START domain-containing protein [Thalassomonas sp. RHCl1]|uniref:START domain-containing protein n=1 Tax=Thalassomonas sp. RHCl1 TaxID=2995320 RepID=UPI00248C285C|nr:START domain-containing protein [Thalassomonas sp. RHCl1]